MSRVETLIIQITSVKNKVRIVREKDTETEKMHIKREELAKKRKSIDEKSGNREIKHPQGERENREYTNRQRERGKTEK
jgi:hypothetical protein